MRKYLLDAEEMVASGGSGLLSLNLEDDRSGYLRSLDLAEFPEIEPPYNSILMTQFHVTISILLLLSLSLQTKTCTNWERRRKKVPTERDCSFTGSSISIFCFRIEK